MPGNLTRLLAAVHACKTRIPEPRPIPSVHRDACVLIVGQAPGRKVHAGGSPWNDASGERLRAWRNVDQPTFYSPRCFAIIPIGFCYPGTGRSGDLPTRRECGVLATLPHIELKILIGHSAQTYYPGERGKPALTGSMRHGRDYWPGHLPLPSSSPRNIGWFKANPWLKQEVIPALRRHPAMRALYKETR